MEMNSRAINKGECFCCSKNDVKKVFADTEISIYFGYFARHNVSPHYEKHKEYKGKIIAQLYKNGRRLSVGETDSGMLNFYVMKESEYTQDLRKEFVDKILPAMRSGYLAQKEEELQKVSGTYVFEVELYEGKLIVHERIENWRKEHIKKNPLC